MLQFYVESLDGLEGARERVCPHCLARLQAGSEHAIGQGLAFAYFCEHDAALYIAREMSDSWIELSVSGPLTPRVVSNILAQENAGGFRMAYQTAR
ncbi:hypothetical protein [Cupriavidus consociatus]|uniref:hypothetical protein n=1 Tax=Cupriavidus consociatus TaxID=2821357 RepID=UPI001AE3B278|nr:MULTISPECIES: hypothetical protein [unclassified Cupriavidus]MBP0620695.1 hypothetical protein [Cupriavidus sp. LEh25]MDK2657355.1 hypothetical protein [Cupriavidus sp. LEh21]